MPDPAREFRALKLAARLACVKEHGEYIASRRHGGHHIHLYKMNGFYCEVWMRVGWSSVEWIELAHDPDRLSEYVSLDPNDLV